MNDENNMIATVDLGSNSFRLEICKNNNGQLQVIDSMKDMVKFAAGLNQKKILNKESQKKALECLKIYGERLKGLKKKQVRIVATNTFRIAKNINPFIEKAQKLLGFPIEIIAGKEEARLIYTGVKHSLPNNEKKILIIDIGGGSTEFTYGKNTQPDITESISIGCVSYSKKFFPKGNISSKAFNKALNTAIFQIQQVSNKFKNITWDLAIGTSGSAKAIRDVIIEHLNYPDDNITYNKILLIVKEIIKAKNINNININGLKQDRTDVFLGGLVIMMSVFKELKINKMIVSEFALRKGVIYDLIGRSLDTDLRDETVTAFQKRYNISLSQVKRVENITILLLKSIGKIAKESYQDLSWAIKLHEIGLSISHVAYHKHSAYIIENSDMPGFSKTEQYIISLLALSHRGNLKKMKALIIDQINWSAILCLRIAVIFCRARIDLKLPKRFKIKKLSNNAFNLIISKEWLLKNSLISNALQIEAKQWKKIKIPLFINKTIYK